MEMEYGQNYVVLVHKGVSFVTKFARPHSNKTKFSSEVSSYLFATSIKSIPHICHFFTQAKILDRKFYTEERVNYDKRISRQNSINCDLFTSSSRTSM